MFIKKFIQEAVQETGCAIETLEPDYAVSIRKSIEEKYALPVSRALWDRIKHYGHKCDPNAWECIADFPIKGKVILFFDKDDEKAMYLINNNRDAVEIIAECPLIVFYLTNENSSFLIGFSDHDNLIGAGEAESWVKEL